MSSVASAPLMDDPFTWANRAVEEAEQMRKVSKREEGLFNTAQAVVLLDVSKQRVFKLMSSGILTRYEFFGTVFLSAREVIERRQQDIKAGRPARNLVNAAKTYLKVRKLRTK